MKKKRIAQSAGIGLILVSTLVAGYAFQKTPGSDSSEMQQTSAYPSPSSGMKGDTPDNWKKVDDFKNELPTRLQDSYADPHLFVITDLARQYSAIRVGGFPVCADVEISAEQYIQLSEIAKKLVRYNGTTSQMNKLLDSPTGITDCQFRVLDSATVRGSSVSNLL